MTVPQKSDFGHDFGTEKDAGEGFKEENNLYAHAYGHRAAHMCTCTLAKVCMLSTNTNVSEVILASVTFFGIELVEIGILIVHREPCVEVDPVILALGMLRKENLEFEANLGNIART